MPLITVTPTSHATPDPGFGSDGSMSSLTNVGYASTTVQDPGIGAGQAKSCRWSAFQPVGGQIVSLFLKFDWQITSGGADVDDNGGEGGATAAAEFDIDLSIDGGSTFPTSLVSRGGLISGTDDFSLIESGSINQAIAASTPIGNIQVRVRESASALASGGGSAAASVTSNVANIELLVTTRNADLIFIL